MLQLLGLSTVPVATTSAVEDSPDAFVELETQETDGNTLVISEVKTPVDGELMIQDQVDGRSTVFGETHLSADTHETDLTIELDQPIEETQTIEVWLFDGDRMAPDSSVLTVEETFVTLEDDPDTLGISLIDPQPEDGFNYPYLLYTPSTGTDGEVPLLVEPNNTGTSTDDFDQHLGAAEDLLMRSDSNDISNALEIPLLVPVFPRPRSEPVDWRHYIHALDRESMSIDDGDLERVDLQLLKMVEHAKDEVLSETEYTFSDRIALNGFSASGNFVERFTLLHPERVSSVTAGGLNGMTVLPLEEADGRELPFHVGISDVEELTGEPVDLEALDEVDKLYFMGEDDDNDTIPYNDAWNEELRELALDVYGEDMIVERFPRCQEAYRDAGVEAQFKLYEDLGHSTRGVTDDLVEFHRSSLEGEDVSGFGEPLLTDVAFEIEPESPGVRQQVTFDGTASTAGIGEIINYSWDLGDGETAVGDVVTHEFDEAGAYVVTLTVISDEGVKTDVTETVTVTGENGTDSTDEEEADDSSNETVDDGEVDDGSDEITDSGEVDDASPGLGVGTAVTSIGGALYALRSRMNTDSAEND